MATVKEIKELLPNLPEKDIPLALKYLEIRDFESLKELVLSAEYKVRKSLNSEKPKKEYLEINLEKLLNLALQVTSYYKQLTNEEDWEDSLYNEII